MNGQGQARDTKLWERVHRATTREEREAVYRFRYQVYYEEFGASVRALSPGRLLVVPGKAVERLAERKRELAAPLFDYVSVLAAHHHELPKAA